MGGKRLGIFYKIVNGEKDLEIPTKLPNWGKGYKW
jgi:hypothetical protein